MQWLPTSLQPQQPQIAVAESLSNDEVNHCGQWKSDKQQQDAYERELESKLCKGGAITYQHIDGSLVTDDWIIDFVVLNMREHVEWQGVLFLDKNYVEASFLTKSQG